jgi:hypothetical protein
MASFLVLLGLGFDIWGVLLLANAYLGTARPRQRLRLLINALARGAAARGAARAIDQLATEDKLRSLQGLAFIGLGFVLQACGVLIAALTG